MSFKQWIYEDARCTSVMATTFLTCDWQSASACKNPITLLSWKMLKMQMKLRTYSHVQITKCAYFLHPLYHRYHLWWLDFSSNCLTQQFAQQSQSDSTCKILGVIYSLFGHVRLWPVASLESSWLSLCTWLSGVLSQVLFLDVVTDDHPISRWWWL